MRLEGLEGWNRAGGTWCTYFSDATLWTHEVQPYEGAVQRAKTLPMGNVPRKNLGIYLRFQQLNHEPTQNANIVNRNTTFTKPRSEPLHHLLDPATDRGAPQKPSPAAHRAALECPWPGRHGRDQVKE